MQLVELLIHLQMGHKQRQSLMTTIGLMNLLNSYDLMLGLGESKGMDRSNKTSTLIQDPYMVQVQEELGHY